MATCPLKGSEKAPLPNARVLGPADPQERLEVSVIVRPQARAALEEHVSRLARGDRSGGPLSREAFAPAHGASAAHLAAVRRPRARTEPDALYPPECAARHHPGKQWRLRGCARLGRVHGPRQSHWATGRDRHRLITVAFEAGGLMPARSPSQCLAA